MCIRELVAKFGEGNRHRKGKDLVAYQLYRYLGVRPYMEHRIEVGSGRWRIVDIALPDDRVAIEVWDRGDRWSARAQRRRQDIEAAGWRIVDVDLAAHNNYPVLDGLAVAQEVDLAREEVVA